MLPLKVFSLAVLVVVVSSQSFLKGDMGGAGMSGGMRVAGMPGGIGGAGMPGGMRGAGMPGGMRGAGMPGGMGAAGMFGGMGGAGMGGAGMFGEMGEAAMFGGMGMFMTPDMMDTLSDMYGSRMAMQAMPGFGMGSGMRSGLGNFPNPSQQFPMGQFLPQMGAKGSKGGRPPTQTFTGIGAIVKTISGIGGNIGPTLPATQSNPSVSNPATADFAYFPRTAY